jgi:tetratricopeptide (TPR) repeat protein
MARPKQHRTASKHRTAWHDQARTQAVVLVLAVLVVYAQTLRFGYVLDDKVVLSNNHFVQQGFAGIPKIMTTDMFAGSPELVGNLALSGGRYRPLSMVLFAVQWQIVGDKPAVFHLTNLVLYALAVLMLFVVLRLMLLNPSARPALSVHLPFSPRLPFAASLLFALHPIHTEAVANIKSADELLCLLFTFVTLYAALRFNAENHSARSWHSYQWLAVSALSFTLALFAKETALTMMLVLPLVLWCVRQWHAESFSDTSLAKPALQAAVLVVCGLALLGFRTSIVGFVDARAGEDIFSNPFLNASTSERTALIATVLGRYLLNAFFPLTMSSDYGYNQIPRTGWAHWEPLLAVVVCAALAVLAVRWLRSGHVLGLCAVWFAASISIVSNIVVNIGGVMGDRFLLLPSVASTLALAWLLLHGLPNLLAVAEQRVLATLACVALLYLVRALVRVPAWESDFTLMKADVQSAPNSMKNRDRYAEQLLAQAARSTNPAERATMLALLDEAERQLHAALAIDAREASTTWNFIAQLHGLRGQQDSAVIALEHALRLRPQDSTIRVNWSLTKAMNFVAINRLDSAASAFQNAIAYERQPQRKVQLWSNLGVVYVRDSAFGAAKTAFERALAINPAWQPARDGMNLVLQHEQQRQSSSSSRQQ